MEEDPDDDFLFSLCAPRSSVPGEHVPRGVVYIKKENRKGVQRKREVDRPDKHILAGEGKAAWKAAKGNGCNRYAC